MRREWIYFDDRVIRHEFGDLTLKDRAKLMALMEHYRISGNTNPVPAKIDDYGDGLKRLRHIKPAYKGRLLFFVVEGADDLERLVVVSVFVKQGQTSLRMLLNGQ